MPVRRAISIVVITWMAIGCAKETNFAVSGEATFQGQPIPLGEVQMMPDSTKGNRGPATMARIVDGKYTTPPGKGMVGGPYALMITGYESPLGSDDPTAADYGDPLFATQVEYVDFPTEDTVHNIDLN